MIVMIASVPFSIVVVHPDLVKLLDRFGEQRERSGCLAVSFLCWLESRPFAAECARAGTGTRFFDRDHLQMRLATRAPPTALPFFQHSSSPKIVARLWPSHDATRLTVCMWSKKVPRGTEAVAYERNDSHGFVSTSLSNNTIIGR